MSKGIQKSKPTNKVAAGVSPAMGPSRIRSALVLALLTVTTVSSWAKGLVVTAELEPAEITFGDSAQLTVTVNGQNAGAPNLPSVPGLSFEPAGQSSQIQIINGAMSANIRHSYIVTPSRPGTFTIPRFKVGGGADAAESNPLLLKVLKRSGAIARQQQGSAATPNLPAPAVFGANEELPSIGRNEIGFLRAVMPKSEFYVGERVPVELKAYFRAGVELRVDGLPQLNSDAFTMNKLGAQPARSQELIQGEPFTVFTWPTAITAVKAGDYDMSVEIPTTVTVRQRAARPRSPFGNSFFDDAFNDSFFDSFFGSAAQKQIKLSSAGAGVRILSVPTENRPASFAGAVGTFEITAAATPTRASAGDPVTLKLDITGRGNFDRVASPAFDGSDAWRAYQPGAKFEAGDSAGYEGTKTFEMALMPRQSGQLEIPSLEFSFFDPEKREFVTRTTAPILIDVSPGSDSTKPLVAGPEKDFAFPADPIQANAAPPASVTDKMARFNKAVRAFLARPTLVLALVLVPIGLVPVFGLVRWRQRLARDPKRLRREATRRAIALQLKSMETAVRQNDAGAFFSAACCALQHRLAERWHMPAEAITLAEINTRLNGEADGFRPIFQFADDLKYSGRTFPVADLAAWNDQVMAELRHLEVR